LKILRTDHKLGLIGYPLSHSFSPAYFSDKFEQLGITDSEYQAYPLLAIDFLHSEVLSKGVTGFNITIPYKEQIIPYLDALSEEASAVGAVNTVKIENGRLVGYNTDVFGFASSLNDQLNGEKIEKALVLGSGGASKAVQYVLRSMNITYQVVSRKPPNLTYQELTPEIMSDHKLIINTTPLGMYPNVDKCPDIGYDQLTDQHFLYDLVYNPQKTLFLKRGEQKGSSIKNGHDMLALQADKSWQIWNQQ